MNFKASLAPLLIVVTLIFANKQLSAYFGCKNYVKTYQRAHQAALTAKIPVGSNKFNNWITFSQMEARRNEKWQARMKRIRDRKREAQAVVAV